MQRHAMLAPSATNQTFHTDASALRLALAVVGGPPLVSQGDYLDGVTPTPYPSDLP